MYTTLTLINHVSMGSTNQCLPHSEACLHIPRVEAQKAKAFHTAHITQSTLCLQTDSYQPLFEMGPCNLVSFDKPFRAPHLTFAGRRALLCFCLLCA